MKNIITILVLFLSYTCLSQDSFNTIDQEIKYNIDLKLDKVSYGGSHYNSGGNIPVGVGMMVGGSSFIVAGLLTPPTYVGGSTTEKKPFFQQPKFLPILTGSLFFTIGIGVSISGN